MSDKRKIRSLVRERLLSLSACERDARSMLLLGKIDKYVADANLRVIALYASLPDEPRTQQLIELLAGRFTIVLPRVCGDVMDFYPYVNGALQCGAFGIDEPLGEEPVSPDIIDVAIIPGVAFSVAGCRLGRGKGYYDRYMSREGFRAFKIGVCFAEQLLDELPCESHDIMMDTVIYV